jgi:hypothetical protein
MRASFVLIVFLAFAFPAPVLSQQENSTWKEYRSAADGFALTVPSLPTPHDSPALPGATVYVVPLKADSGVVLRVKKEGRDCSGVVALLKNLKSQFSNDPSSVREISIEGHPGVEYRWKKSSASTILERWYCVGDRLYVFSVNWPSAQPFPTEATMILDSFRLLPKEATH